MARLRSSNAALPRSPQHHPERQLTQVEAFYAKRGLPTAVQVSPAASHVELDEVLGRHGYRWDVPIEVLTAETADVAAIDRPLPAGRVGLADEPTAAWRAAFTALDGHPDSAAVADRIIAKIGLPAAYVSLTPDHRPAGVGLIVGGPASWGGVYCMVTHPDFRQRGIGSAILVSGAGWALQHGISRLYLQVEQANQPARRMYGALGFGHAYSYHYRLARR